MGWGCASGRVGLEWTNSSCTRAQCCWVVSTRAMTVDVCGGLTAAAAPIVPNHCCNGADRKFGCSCQPCGCCLIILSRHATKHMGFETRPAYGVDEPLPPPPLPEQAPSSAAAAQQHQHQPSSSSRCGANQSGQIAYFVLKILCTSSPGTLRSCSKRNWIRSDSSAGCVGMAPPADVMAAMRRGTSLFVISPMTTC